MRKLNMACYVPTYSVYLFKLYNWSSIKIIIILCILVTNIISLESMISQSSTSLSYVNIQYKFPTTDTVEYYNLPEYVHIDVGTYCTYVHELPLRHTNSK